MRVAEVAGLKGVGGEVRNLIRVWKSVEKGKNPPSKNDGGAPGLLLRSKQLSQ